MEDNITLQTLDKKIDRRFGELHDLIENLAGAVKHGFDAQTEQISGIKTDITELKSDVVGLKSDVVGLKSDVGGLKSDVVGLKSDVGGLKSDVAELKTGLKLVNTRVDQIYNILDASVGRDKKFELELAALGHKYSRLEEKIEKSR